jgi:hypothetical protein
MSWQSNVAGISIQYQPCGDKEHVNDQRMWLMTIVCVMWVGKLLFVCQCFIASVRHQFQKIATIGMKNGEWIAEWDREKRTVDGSTGRS